MDEKSLEMLGFPQVRKILAGHTHFEIARELALNLRPGQERQRICRLLKEAAEARCLLVQEPGFSIGEASDIREPVTMAAKGKTLDPGVLVSTRKTLASIRSVRASLKNRSQEFPFLWDIVQRMTPLPHLEHDIDRCISPDGEILDSASERLVSLKQELRETRQRLLTRLNNLITRPAMQPLWQEPLITEREGRYVVPVKVESARQLKGIVHDVSNTGATVFVEPLEMVEMGNGYRRLRAAEKQELERILSSLSSAIGLEETVIRGNLTLLARLELALTKARYAERERAIEPIIAGNGDANDPGAGVLKLVNARHPLLREKAVPITVETGRDFSVLVITGPNTGGKTVTLKTIGLLSIMAQAGMLIPAAEGSSVPVFDRILADIGDEQSIEQTLSTFSWHMSNLVRIIREVTPRSLVLLDELGTSTDPGEGAALARAILLHFRDRSVTAVATTHFSELKAFAHSTPGVENASLDFDPVTFAPTYHLTVGIPGGSNALMIAARLGLPVAIIESARSVLSRGTEELERLLTSLMAEKQQLATVRDELEKARDAASKLRSELERELQALKEQEKRLLRETRDRLVARTAQMQKEFRRITREIKKARVPEDVIQVRRALDKVSSELGAQDWVVGMGRGKEGPIGESRPLAVGDCVWLMDTGLRGTVTAVSARGRQLEVTVGSSKIRIRPESVLRTTPPSTPPPEKPAVTVSVGTRASLELDLRGRRADEVESELDSYLNNAALSGLNQVRIIHGVGSGTVRQIVRQTLAGHPLVTSFRPGGHGEGNDGATMVQL